MTDAEIEVVAELQYPFEAELVAGRLEAEGIEAWVGTTGVLGISWLQPGHFGGVAVSVRKADVGRARELLAAVEEEYEPELPEQYREAAGTAPCPSCGSLDKRFHRERPLHRLFAQPGTGSRWECKVCGHRWSADEGG